MNLGMSDKVIKLRAQVAKMMQEEIIPLDSEYLAEVNKGDRWQFTERQTEIIETLKSKAKERDLWNFWLTDSNKGYGLTTVEYAYLAEEMGKAHIGAEVFNCSAPDTGNMEVLVRYGTDEQKNKYLNPLLEGKTRSAFAMTEPDVASSDATNITSEIKKDGNQYVLNGTKWWTSGAMDPRCDFYIFMGKTDPNNSDIHKQQSMILVDKDTPGITIKRHLPVFGFDDAPHGHAEIEFKDVKVPPENMLLGEGRGFEIAQGRLGPGRIHHCMRTIGLAEAALEAMCKRLMVRKAFGKELVRHSVWQERIADARINIEMTRLLTLKAAKMMDDVGNKVAKNEIAMIKVAAPIMALKIIDDAIQAYGGAGVTTDPRLAQAYAGMRTLRLADGPDEVHRLTIARNELKKYL